MTEYVSRVLKTHAIKNSSELASRNIPLMTLLKEIDPTQKYFLYPESCEPGKLLKENKKDGITKEKAIYSEFLKKGNQTLVEYLKQNILTETQKKHIKKSINLLHKHKIVHGDLHGYNFIFLDGLPRIIDFSKHVLNSSKQLIKKEKEYVNDVFPEFDLKKNNNSQKLHDLYNEIKLV